VVTFDQEVPVTTVVTHVVRPGVVDDFERWLHDVAAEATTFEGHVGVHVIRPGEGSREYTIIFRFNTPRQLRAWLESDRRAARLREGVRFFEDHGQVQQLSGLEAWFTLPGQSAVAPPPRYKMALTTFAATLSLLMILPRLLAPLLTPLPPIGRTSVVCATMIVLMTYAIMPALTRLLAGWLRPRPR
jgi:antibiotic biosynthesis monooxygenase (ABM) superfamily enzyme